MAIRTELFQLHTNQIKWGTRLQDRRARPSGHGGCLEELRDRFPRFLGCAESSDPAMQRAAAMTLVDEAGKLEQRVAIIRLGGVRLLFPLAESAGSVRTTSRCARDGAPLPRRRRPGKWNSIMQRPTRLASPLTTTLQVPMTEGGCAALLSWLVNKYRTRNTAPSFH